MSKLKDKISSVVFLWIGAGLALIAMLMIPAPALSYGTVLSSGALFWNIDNSFDYGNWTMFVGYMLILVAGLMMAALAIPTFQPAAKVEKIILIIAGSMLVVGIILLCLFRVIFLAMNGWLFTMANVYTPYAGPFIAAGLAFLALGCDITALALDW